MGVGVFARNDGANLGPVERRFAVKSTVGTDEAKTQLPHLLERVAKGERITITKHGVPVATLQAASPRRSLPVAEAIAELRLFRKLHPMASLGIRELVKEGRR
jgi:prevent-host-death family protein